MKQIGDLFSQIPVPYNTDTATDAHIDTQNTQTDITEKYINKCNAEYLCLATDHKQQQTASEGGQIEDGHTIYTIHVHTHSQDIFLACQ